MASPSLHTSSGSFLSEPSPAVLHPRAVGSLVPNDSAARAPACIADRSLCPDGADSPVYAQLQGGNESPPLAPMPFATPATMPPPPPPPPTSTAMLTSILTLYTAAPAGTSTPAVAAATPSTDPMLSGNPSPPWHLHTSTIVGIAGNGVLAFSILPLLVFGLVMKWRLKKAKAFQLGQGPRRRVWDEAGWRGDEERRRELLVEDVFVRGFRRRAEGRGVGV
ncbi:MAG: hypothetical protein Q9206_000837 [Seirophora lacunosa]